MQTNNLPLITSKNRLLTRPYNQFSWGQIKVSPILHSCSPTCRIKKRRSISSIYLLIPLQLMPAAKNAEHSPLTTFYYNFEDLVDFYIYKSTGKSAIQRYSAQRYIIPSLVILSSHVKLKKKNIFSIFYGPFPLPPHSHSSYQTLQYLTVRTFPLSFDLTASYFLPPFSFASNTCLELLPFDNVNRYKFRTFGKSRLNPSLGEGSKHEEHDLT